MTIEDQLRRLKGYNQFQECLLLDYWSENLCRDFVVLVSNIWTGPSMRTDLDTHDFVRLHFRQCQRVHIENAFSATVLAEPDRVNWGINEFSVLNVEPKTEELFIFTFLWENKRRLEVECHGLDVVPIPASNALYEKYRWQENP